MPAVRQSCAVVCSRVLSCGSDGIRYPSNWSSCVRRPEKVVSVTSRRPRGVPSLNGISTSHTPTSSNFMVDLCLPKTRSRRLYPRVVPWNNVFMACAEAVPTAAQAITPPTISSPWKSRRAAAVVTLAIKIEGRFSAAFTEFAVAGIESCQAPQSHGPYGLQGGGALRRQPDPGGRVATPCRPIDTPRVSHGRDRRFSARPASTPDCATRRGVRRARCLISCFRWSQWSFCSE